MSWKIDPAHSQITFTVRHMMITNVHGRFENFTGEVDVDEQNPINSSVAVQIEAASINTREAKRDAHLKSPDFLNADEFPTLSYKSKAVVVKSENSGQIIGDLTIRGVTREVVLDVEYAGQSKSPWGQTSAGFTATTQINRKDWDLGWNVALETGGWLVGDTIRIDIELELIKQEEPELEKAM